MLILIFSIMGNKMGLTNFINTLLNTSYELLMDTVFRIMSIAVIAGAISGILSEFGVVSLINKGLAFLMKPIYDMPGAGVISILTTYLSDNPAVLTLADDPQFRKYFKKYQLPALTNIGTSFGMGLIITVFMLSLPNPNNEDIITAVLVGNLGAIVGSIISVRLMLKVTKKIYGTNLEAEIQDKSSYDILEYREIQDGGIGERVITSLLEGGKSGVKIGFDIIPGVLIICSIVMILTNTIPENGVYTGAAYEGIGLLPWIGQKLNFIISPLFGFSSPSNISVPITALGAAGAAIGLIPDMINNNLVYANDIAVFTSMCMCFSGYLSTHVAMMDSLNFRELTGKAIICHTIGGLSAGIFANWFFKLFQFF